MRTVSLPAARLAGFVGVSTGGGGGGGGGGGDGSATAVACSPGRRGAGADSVLLGAEALMKLYTLLLFPKSAQVVHFETRATLVTNEENGRVGT